MAQICPTITAFDTASFQSQLVLVSSFAKRLHIDIMDGEFAPTMSPRLEELQVTTDAVVDIHVMYQRPQAIMPDLIALRPNLVIVHAESDADIPLFATRMREHNIQTGLALLPETSVATVAYLVPHIQHVLIFGGHLGYHGGQADLQQLHKIKELHVLSKTLEYGWDGGANLENVTHLAEAGIDVINIGGCIHQSDKPVDTYNALVRLVA